MLSIVLDSGPLALIVHQRTFPAAIECREWVDRHIAKGNEVLLPAIVVYELRRELLRIGSVQSVQLLDELIGAAPQRYIVLTDNHLRLAAKLWADVRKSGKPTADPHALDIDVIVAAQAMSLGHNNYVVATTNLAHLSRLVRAEEWRNI